MGLYIYHLRGILKRLGRVESVDRGLCAGGYFHDFQRDWGVYQGNEPVYP